MFERTDQDYLCHIRDSAKRISFYINQMVKKDFLDDIKTQYAVIRNLEIIREASKNISDDLKNKYTEIPWKNLAGIRDKLIHHYFGINLDIAWEVTKKELPELLIQINRIGADND